MHLTHNPLTRDRQPRGRSVDASDGLPAAGYWLSATGFWLLATGYEIPAAGKGRLRTQSALLAFGSLLLAFGGIVSAGEPGLGKPDADGFYSLFNGKDLTGWIGSVTGYTAEDGMLVCKKGGKLWTKDQYSDFIFKFEFRLPAGANNGVGIRSDMKGDPAYSAMEIQVLDNSAKKYAKLKPWQYHGSVYGLVAAKRGHQKPVGEWNSEEIHAIGRKIKVILNGTVIVDCDLDEVKKNGDPANLKRHPGMDRKSGHIGFLGHGSRVEFRNLRVKPLADATAPAKVDAGKTQKAPAKNGANNTKKAPAQEAHGSSDEGPYAKGPHNVPPEGFVALFNGKDLTGWKGLVGNPKTRAKMTPEQLAAAEKKATEKALQHWKVIDGTIVYDGKAQSLCTAKDYANFEMYVDWKIHKKGDSGIYLRGSPQVQIWDPARWPEGSGGLYNNKKNPRKPLKCADRPIGQWNRFRIKMVGEKVWVWLNEELVVDNVTMENYWERKKPIYPKGQIELQHHGSTLWFRNIYIKELP